MTTFTIGQKLRVNDTSGHYAGDLHVLDVKYDTGKTYVVRWHGGIRKLEVPDAELQRMVEPARVRA